METITMRGKEATRPGILKALSAERITNQQAADALALSVRQVQRLARRYEDEGAAGRVHRGRGQPSPRRLADPVRAQILRLMATVYAGFNDVHLTEKLCEVDGLAISRATVRRLRHAAGRPPTRRRRAPAHRRRRTREAAAGSVLQVDGSHHAWLEERGPRLTLLGAIDDATGAILGLHFRPTEDLHGYVTLFQDVFSRHGLPLALYGDCLNVFVRNDRHWSLEEELRGTQDPTALGQMLQELSIAYIAAHSPQAKGRIERLWETLQDRLVSELRLAGIATLEAANAFLPRFIADYNRRFAKPPASATAVWRPAPSTLAQTLSCRYARVVARDSTVRLGDRWVQLPRGPRARSYVGCRVEVRELLDGRVLVPYQGAVLATQAASDPAFTLVPRSRRSRHPERTHRARAPQPPASSPPLAATRRRSPRTSARRQPAGHPWRSPTVAELQQRRRHRRGMTLSLKN
jgi:transposase